jgi:hypothetical protein
MIPMWRMTLSGLAVAGLAAMTPLAAQAASGCGDLNNDGQRNSADVLILSQCVANSGTCPAVSPGPLCGTGNLIDCGDFVKDGDVTGPELALDLGQMSKAQAGLATLYDACQGPGPVQFEHTIPGDATVVGCPGGTVTLGSQTITASRTWPASCKVVIGGTVLVGPNPIPGTAATVLKIEAGSVVHGLSTATDPPVLVFLPKTRVDAQGTAAAPIILTSSKAPGTKGSGDWGGIMFNGQSTVNGPNCQSQSEGVPDPFGGCIANDYSGVASFLRAEFAGLDFTPDNELNAFTMNGVGSQTQFNFIQGHDGGDDCIEWFGGTINMNHLVSTACGDDALDFQLGFTGSVQNAVVFYNGQRTDPNNRDERGIEADNSEFDNFAVPISNPAFCNVTMIGSRGQAAYPDNGGTDVGLMLRRGTYGQFANFVVTGFQDAGVELRDTATTGPQGAPASPPKGACIDADSNGIPESLSGNLVIRNSVFYQNGNFPGAGTEQAKDNDGSLDVTGGADTGPCAAANCACDTEGFYSLLVSTFNVVPTNGTNGPNPGISDQYPSVQDNTACTGLETPYSCCSGAGTGSCLPIPDVRATGGGLPAAYTCKDINPLFSNLTYIGGVNPAAVCTGTSCDWLSKPWNEFAIN